MKYESKGKWNYETNVKKLSGNFFLKYLELEIYNFLS